VCNLCSSKGRREAINLNTFFFLLHTLSSKCHSQRERRRREKKLHSAVFRCWFRRPSWLLLIVIIHRAHLLLAYLQAFAQVYVPCLGATRFQFTFQYFIRSDSLFSALSCWDNWIKTPFSCSEWVSSVRRLFSLKLSFCYIAESLFEFLESCNTCLRRTQGCGIQSNNYFSLVLIALSRVDCRYVHILCIFFSFGYAFITD
jgi:hypothetical protein